MLHLRGWPGRVRGCCARYTRFVGGLGMTEEQSGYVLAHPVYLDVAMMISFRAYLEGGVVTSEEATRTETGARERVLKGHAGLRARLPWALNAEAGTEASNQRHDE